MKTLDEVIKANECCDHGELDSRCEDCPYNGIGACCAERESDALYYLREYRSDMKLWESDRKGFEAWIEQYKEARDKHQQAVIDMAKNPPLSWEELKAMEGKPVWVETKYYSSRWAVITDVDDVRISFVGKQLLDSEIVQEMGESWQAYRKERS